MIRVSRQMGDTIYHWKTCLDAIVESPPELPGELRDTARRITQHHQAKELMEVLAAQMQTVQRDVDLVEAVAAIVLESGESDRYIVQRLRRLILRPDELMKVEEHRPGMRCEKCSEIPSGMMLLFRSRRDSCPHCAWRVWISPSLVTPVEPPSRLERGCMRASRHLVVLSVRRNEG